jgi:hypothetical protein
MEYYPVLRVLYYYNKRVTFNPALPCITLKGTLKSRVIGISRKIIACAPLNLQALLP